MQSEFEHYLNYTEEDFLVDPVFQDWVLNPSEDKNGFWDQLQLRHPSKSAAIQNARQLLTQLTFKEEFPSGVLVNQKFNEYQQRIRLLREFNSESSDIHPQKHRILRWPSLLKVAAVATGLILVSYLIIQLTTTGKTETWSTAYGEQQTLYLPDSTMVVLNSNSRVRISKWKNNQPREVWLEGEAYFDVKHLNKNTSVTERLPFTVHTQQVEIDVLGTAFDVRERRGITEVVLERGLIKLNSKRARSAVMHPGDRIVYSAAADTLNRSSVDVTDYLKWREKKLLLVDPTAAEICKYLEDNFGKKILFEDSTLQHKKIEGPILINNLDDALFVISTVLNTRISKKDSVIILRPK
jgi:ferric-dicitrate binding protein FerR (iron transport regulator)